MFGLGPTELIIIFILVIVLFGAKKLPELARSSGEALKEFKKATRDAMAEDDEPVTSEPARRMEASSEPVDSQKTTTSA